MAVPASRRAGHFRDPRRPGPDHRDARGGPRAQTVGHRDPADRDGRRRHHRHRHLRRHRRGRRHRRARRDPLLRARRGRLHVLRALLRRARLVDPGVRQRVHLRVRDARRARRLDHRLGPDPRVRRVGRRGRGRLGRQRQRLPRARPSAWTLPDAISQVARRTAACSTCRPCSSCWRSRCCWCAAPGRARGANLVMVGVKLRRADVLHRRRVCSTSAPATCSRSCRTASTA